MAEAKETIPEPDPQKAINGDAPGQLADGAMSSSASESNSICSAETVVVNDTDSSALSNGQIADGDPQLVTEEAVVPAKAAKLQRGSHFRKLIKRKSTKVSEQDADKVQAMIAGADRVSLDGDRENKDKDSTCGSTEDLQNAGPSAKPRSHLLRKRITLGNQTGSTSSISSKDSSSEEREPGSILSRQLSRKNSSAKNPIRENDTTRLLLLFMSTLLGWILKLIIFLWRQGVSFFSDEPDPAGGDSPAEIIDKVGIIPLKPEIKTNQERIYFICNELKNTEAVYVDRLQILVAAKERATAIVGPEIAKQMFKDIEVICLFHSSYLLPDLKERMAKWEEHRKIGDVMRKLTPYLKLYTDYVKDFQKAAALVDYWENKSSAFAAMIREIRDNQAARHGKLKVQAHMIEPIQRVPRYELLLRDYLKRIGDDAPDKPDAEQALESVARAASHFEDVMKRDSRIAKLIEVRERLDSFVNIVLPTREFISEHKLNIYSERQQKPSEKTCFLFNDLFLVCTRQKMQKIMTSMKLKVKVAIDLREAELISGTNLDIPFTLWIQTKENHVEICLSSLSEMVQWRQSLQGLIDAFTKTLLRNSTCSSTDSMDGDECIEPVHGGHVQLSSDDDRTWRRRWALVGTCGRLGVYKSQQDKTPISWIRIVRFELESAQSSKKANTLSLQGFGRKYYLHLDTQNDFNEWFEVLQRYQDSSSSDGPGDSSQDMASSEA